MKTLHVNEFFREYIWGDGKSIRITNVRQVAIADSGSHRVTDVKGVTTYIPSGWFYFKFKGEVIA
ncbi:hypothetical protein NVP1121O_188 [Vibrio phage 1.121.O._10N.286.46.C4]|nr:hypothetical protein NVP1121O_188 [Vibrio phage 1.121.O._10N.286.46.C4]